MAGRNLSIAVGLMLIAGCSASSGSDPSFGESSDGASTESAVEPSSDARPGEPLADAAGASAVDGYAAPSDSGGSHLDATEGRVDARGGGEVDARRGEAGESSDAGEEADVSERSAGDGGDAQGGALESGRLVGITAAHNAVRAMVQTQPPLPPLVWSQTIADYAQQWATSLATTMCAQPVHRTGAELQAKGYGENLATFSGGGALGAVSTAQQAVDAWAAEEACWTYGTIQGTEKCDVTCYTNLHSDGCGHYTQVVWRGSTQLGCGVASCKNRGATEDIWICNYAPAGNFIGRSPY